jgi:uncharacterized DUF497 family protein
MLEKLYEQVDGKKFSWNGLNTLCWAIGSISGAMTENDEKRFLSLGVTNNGRFLTIIFTIRKKKLIRVISARDMSRKERKAYEENE